MPKIQYIEKRFRQSTLDVIEKANDIIDEYQNDGLRLTLRQLYYQFVSRDLLPNKQKEYDRLGGIISKARLAGLVDWAVIEDRTRNLKTYYHNIDPEEAIQDTVDQFCLDKWEDQPCYVEVWIEKEALVGVIDQICESLDVPYFACKGYNSQSEMWRSAVRMYKKIDQGRDPVIIHLGDHDPSGIDMTRDINDRVSTFIKRHTLEKSVEVKRIALNYDQIERYNPPPNPTKESDSRSKNYGYESSWELDALEPRIIRDLISDTVDLFIDYDIWDERLELEKEYKKTLEEIVSNLKM